MRAWGRPIGDWHGAGFTKELGQREIFKNDVG
jgi:hypothetical protein